MCRLVLVAPVLVVFAISAMVTSVFSRPMGGEDLMTVSDYDTAVVESTVRETRQAVPSHIEDLLEPGTKTAYLEVFGDDDHEKGYQANTKDKGKDGYKKREEFHKKDSDSYGFEKHTEFGMNHKKGKSTKASNKGSQTAPSHDSYSVVESEDDGKKRKNAFEDYEGGHYADGYTEGESEGNSSEADYEGDSGHLESEGDHESEGYTAEEADDESEALTAEEEAEDDY